MIREDLFEQLKISPDSKVVFVSHNDLDGAGPIIIGKNYFTDCKYFTVANNAVDKVVKKVLFDPEYSDREYIFITDCSLTDPQVINYIQHQYTNNCNRKVFLFDHHGTAMWLNTYEWAQVTDEEGVSGTKLFWKYIEELAAERFQTQVFLKLDNLVNCISDWDTWQWVKKGDQIPKLLSELFTKTGINYFVEKYHIDNWNNYKEFDVFTSIDKSLLKDFNIKHEFIIWPAIKKSARVLELPIGLEQVVRKVKCVTINEAVGDMGEKLYEDGIDYVFFFYPETISMRSRVNDVDLGAWAKEMAGPSFSGGGHKQSAGFTIHKGNRWLMDKYLEAKF